MPNNFSNAGRKDYHSFLPVQELKNHFDTALTNYVLAPFLQLFFNYSVGIK
jgi:hypothetical protein